MGAASGFLPWHCSVLEMDALRILNQWRLFSIKKKEWKVKQKGVEKPNTHTCLLFNVYLTYLELKLLEIGRILFFSVEVWSTFWSRGEKRDVTINSSAALLRFRIGWSENGERRQMKGLAVPMGYYSLCFHCNSGICKTAVLSKRAILGGFA